jgi:selenoprotein W-related protein
MASVDVEYCVPCGLLERAQETQRAILEAFDHDLDHVSLTPGDGGVFKIRVDGELIYDKDEEAYDIDVITERIGERV